MKKEISYQQQAREFLDRNGLKFRAVRCVPQQRPEWQEANDKLLHGHWWITIDRLSTGIRLGFPFWTSHNDELAYRGENYPIDDKAQRATARARLGPSAYDVLATISSDVHCPMELKEFCDEYGYDADSKKVEAQFNLSLIFSKRLKVFFSEAELNQLTEIQ